MENENENEQEPISVQPSKFVLNFRKVMSVLQLPTFEEILAKIDEKLPDDQFTINELRRHNKGLFVVTCTKRYEECPESLEFLITNRFKNEPLKVVIPFERWREKGDKVGVLVTIVGAYDDAVSRSIQSITFDSHFMNTLKLPVFRETQVQYHADRRHLTGNRHVVLEIEDKSKIPTEIQFAHNGRRVTFRLRYRGQPWHCTRCNEVHQGPCAMLEAFNKMKEARNLMEIEKTIVSDSTLRHVEEKALDADVICVSGANLGDVATALADSQPRGREVHVVAGINGIMDTRSRLTDEEEYEYHTEKAMAKFQKVIDHFDLKHLYFYIPVLPEEMSETNIAKLKTLHTILSIHANRPDSKITLISTNSWNNLEKVDAYHPTADSTKAILKSIQRTSPSRTLVINEDFQTTDRKYAGVRSANVYGCLSCWSYQRERDDILCKSCQDPAGGFDDWQRKKRNAQTKESTVPIDAMKKNGKRMKSLSPQNQNNWYNTKKNRNETVTGDHRQQQSSSYDDSN